MFLHFTKYILIQCSAKNIYTYYLAMHFVIISVYFLIIVKYHILSSQERDKKGFALTHSSGDVGLKALSGA